MAISVIIRRTVTNKEKAAQLAPLIVRLRSRATAQPGYITGQTYGCIDCEGEYLVISTWHTLADWNNWLNSDERREIQDRIDLLLDTETEYRLYEPLVGGIIPRFQEGTQ
ncbi:MAG: antibiotic biosynthesis monooxygenase [Desulfobacteraceae bacterium]|nr:antibiotic biosynthesis monooxygenase [Desulfobacteraceae bacterium]